MTNGTRTNRLTDFIDLMGSGHHTGNSEITLLPYVKGCQCASCKMREAAGLLPTGCQCDECVPKRAEHSGKHCPCHTCMAKYR